jgi:hypothetical protein
MNQFSDAFVEGAAGDVYTADIRTRLTANTTFYIRTDGSNSNDGSANDAAHAFLTPQYAYDYIVKNIDAAGFDITIKMADGTYNSPAAGDVLLISSIANIGRLYITGNAATPANVIFNADNDAISFVGYVNMGFKTGMTTTWPCAVVTGIKVVAGRCGIYLDLAAAIHISAMDFGTCSAAHIRVCRSSMLTIEDDYTISGNSGYHYMVDQGGYLCVADWAGGTYNITADGARAFTDFAWVANGGWLDFGGGATINFVGTFTGYRYKVYHGGHIDTNPDSPSFLPGNAAGFIQTGGRYNDRMSRTPLYAARTLYVRTDGNDLNDGSADDAAHAFLTFQAAVNAYQLLDCRGFSVTIQFADGTYTAGATIASRVGGGNLNITGNTTTPGNCIISTTSANCITVNGHPGNSYITVSGFKLQTTTSGSCIIVAGGSIFRYSAIEFGACAGYHIDVESASTVQCLGDYAISGGAVAHVLGQLNGLFYNGVAAITITITNTPAFTYFAFAYRLGSVRFTSTVWTFSGSATGSYYRAAINGVVETGNLGASLPGNAAGSTATGGQIT